MQLGTSAELKLKGKIASLFIQVTFEDCNEKHADKDIHISDKNLKTRNFFKYLKNTPVLTCPRFMLYRELFRVITLREIVHGTMFPSFTSLSCFNIAKSYPKSEHKYDWLRTKKA